MDLFQNNPSIISAPASNYIGTNPLETFSIKPDQMKPTYFNPGLYQLFTFDQFPSLSYVIAPVVTTDGTSYIQGTMSTANDASTVSVASSPTEIQFYEFNSTIFYSSLATYDIEYMTYHTHYASSMLIQSVTFSQRFGPELQSVYASEVAATDVFSTFESSQTYGVYSSTDIVYSTLVTATLIGGVWTTTFADTGLYNIYENQGILNSGSTILLDETTFNSADGIHYVGSSMFVNMLGSNVYTGLLVTTNSVIVYENNQVNSYYSESLSYQVNIANLTAALNSVATAGCQTGGCDITVTTFSWVWYTTADNQIQGSQFTDFSNYLFQTTVSDYLYYTYNTTIDNADTAITQVQSLITVENNNLANAQTFLNDSVTQLQSSISTAGQIIGSLASAMQSIINNMS